MCCNATSRFEDTLVIDAEYTFYVPRLLTGALTVLELHDSREETHKIGTFNGLPGAL